MEPWKRGGGGALGAPVAAPAPAPPGVNDAKALKGV